MALSIKGVVVGKITNGFYSCDKYTLPAECRVDYDDCNYAFPCELIFDEMHRPSLKILNHYKLNLQGNVLENIFYINLQEDNEPKEEIIYASFDNEVIPIKHNSLLELDKIISYSYRCTLEFIDGAWTLSLKGCDKRDLSEDDN